MSYSDLFDPAEGDDKAKAGINLRYGIEAQPDQAARDSDLAKRYGLPAGVIESYRSDYESRAKVEDAMPLLEQSPKLRGWLAADPIRAKVSHDDISNLSAIEGAIRYMVSAPDAPRGGLVADVFKAGRAIASGAPSASAGLYGAAAAPFEVLGLDTIGQALRGQQKNAQAVSDSVRGMSPDAGFLEQSLMSGFQSAGQNLITLPFGLAAKTPNLMLGIMGAIAGGQSYGKGRDAGLDPAQAAAFGIQDATAEIVTERFLGAAGFLKNIKAGASAGKLFGYEVFREVPGEIGATLWQNFNEWANVNPDKSVHDFLSEQPAAIAQTIIATLVGGSVQVGAIKGLEAAIGRVAAGEQQAQRAEFGAAQMDAIASIVQASKLNARSPATFDAMVQEMAAENVPAVFVSAQALMQSGVNLDELAKAMPSVAAQLHTAAQTGGDVEIPTSEFVRAVPGSTFQQQMIDHARTSPEAMSRSEAQVFMSEKGDAIKAELDAEITRREEDSTWKMQRDEVAAQFERDLNAVGRWQPDVNKQYATLFGNFYATTASRAGMTAGELAAKYPLRFQATAPGGAVSAMEQGSGVPETGKPITLNYGRNTESSAKFKLPDGMDVGRDLEPSGEFMNVDRTPTHAPDGRWEVGTITFNSPLVLEHNGTGSTGWKKTLSDMFGGKTGKALSKAVKVAGYDGIITHDKYGLNETVNLGGAKTPGATLNQSGLSGDIDIETAKSIVEDEDSDAIPDGWFVHGRSGGSELNGSWPIQMTRDAHVAVGYAGSRGSVWAIKANDKTKVADFTSDYSDDMDSFVESLRDEFDIQKDEGGTPIAAVVDAIEGSTGLDRDQIDFDKFEEVVRDEFTPIKIVDTAGAFDSDVFLALLEYYPGGWPDMVTTPDGAVVLPGSYTNVDRVNLSDVAAGDPANPSILNQFAGLSAKLPATLDIDGQQRSTTNSSGQPIAATEEGVRNFWRWFSPTPAHLLDGLSESEVGSLQRNAKALTDFLEGQAGSSQVDGLAVVPRSVLAHVAGVVNNPKILDAVVRSLPIDVVDFFGRQKVSAKDALHDSAMLEKVFSIDPKPDVSLGIDPSVVALLTVRLVANAGAKIAGLAGGAFKRNAAVLANANDPVLGAHVSKSPRGDLGILAGFGDSKVVDADGKPMVVYHGSGVEFDEFDPGRLGETTGYGDAVVGFHFSDNKADASHYAELAARKADEAEGGGGWGKTGVVREFYLSLQNPLMVGMDESDGNAGERTQEFLDDKNEADSFAAENGMDGIVYLYGTNVDSSYTAIAFQPEQIKSAAGNTGTFDPANPSILNQGPLAQIAIPDAGVMGNTTIITMFDGANLSSVLHEAGHFFLEVQADLAARIAGQIRDGAVVSDGEREILADMNKLLAWFGERDSPEVSALDQWLAKSIDERRAQHERFAESWEQYLMEGKAPSLELAPMFSKFRAWLVNVYKSVRDFLARRGVSQAQGNALEQSAFHGTPHRGIDKFSTEKIGTGEGAQAYGWGLYFASKKEIAEWYRKALTEKNAATGDITLVNGATLKDYLAGLDVAHPLVRAKVSAALAEKRTVTQAKAQAEETRAKLAKGNPPAAEKTNAMYAEVQRVLDGMADAMVEHLEPSPGQLYEVDIPDDGDMLLWDKPLSEQPEKVRSALADAQPLEGSADVGVEAANLLRNLSQRDTGPEQRFSQLDIPSKRVVLSGVRSVLNNLKVRQAVVGLVTVDVVNVLTGEKGATKALLDNPSMLLDLLAANGNDAVAVNINRADAAIRAIALAARTEGLLVEPNSIRVPKNLVAAMRAGKLDQVHGEQIYRMAERELGSAQDASNFLKSVKVAGIKYLDGISRNAGDGSFNYVIFSGDDVAIKNTFYQGGEKQASDIQLTDEVRAVMDRMIATADQIQEAETVRAMGPLFTEQGGMSPEQWAAYQKTGAKATEAAVNALQARAMADMKWLSNARAAKLRELQKQADALRRDIRREVTREVMSRPVYRAWTFLTGKGEADQKAQAEPRVKGSSGALDPATDNIFQAIAKLGGLRRDEVQSQWGLDSKAETISSGVFGRPVVRKEGGLSIDMMTEALVSEGYLMADENGRGDPRDLEEAFDSQRMGVDQFSVAHDYAARAAAANGDETIDPLPDYVTHGKLNTTALREMYGTQADAIWRKLSDRRMTSESGIQPDVLAETMGFASGDAMVRELSDARPPRDLIHDLTDERMLQAHGELATPEGLERATTEALANAVRTRFLAQELQALEDASTVREDAGTNKRGQRRTVDALDKAAEQYAAQTIGAMQIKDIKPHKFEASATRAAKLSAKAFKAGNTAEAAMHKRSELIQLHAAKAAHAALAEIQQTREFFGRINNRSLDKLGKTYDVDVVQAIRAVLGEYGIGTKGEKAAQYLNAVERNDPDMHRVLSAQLTALAADAVPLETLPVDRVRALSDEIGAMWHLARRSKQMEVDGNLIDREEVQADLLARLEEIGIPDTVPGEGKAVTDKERRISRLREAGAALMRVENWAIRKDGADNGAFTRFVFRPIKAASDAYRADKAKALKQYRELLAGIDIGKSRISAPELGYEFGHSRGGSGKAELLHAILHTGNDSNKRKLLLGGKDRSKGKVPWAVELPGGDLDTRPWDNFIERMIREGVLTKADFDFAQGVWDLLETLKPAAQKTHRDVFGRYFDEITANPVVNSMGTWSGGYVPAMTDAEVVKDAKTRELAEAENSTMAFAFPATGKGFTKARVEYNKPLLLDLRSLAGHIDKVLLFSHLEQPVRDVRRVLAAQEVAEPLHKVDPAAFGSLITPWLNRAARQQVETPIPGDGGAMRILSKLRARAGMAAMFANLTNTAQQVTGFSIAAVKVQPRHLMSAAHRWITSPRKTAEAVAEASSYMRERMSAETRQMTQDIQQILLNPSLYERWQDWAVRHAYFMQSAVDNVMGPIIWTGAYNQSLERGESESDARAYADGVIRQTQGSTLPEDISRIESGNAWWRMFAQFVGYFNMQANLLGTEFANQMHDVGLRKGMGKGVFIFTLGFLVPALLSELIVQLFRGGPDDDDKDGQTIDDWFAALGMGTVRSAVAMVPVAGQVANYGINLANNKPYDDRISTAPAISMLESLVRAPFSVYEAAANDKSAQKAVRDVATLISLTTGLPANAIARPVGYVAGVVTDKINPTDPLDMARGLTTGVASPESK